MDDMIYFEDLAVGRKFESAGITLTEAAIVDFALTYDPQPFHIDAEAARHSPYGGLIASGFQTMALSFRMMVQTGLYRAAVGSPGLDEVRWLKPVRPGDTLRTIAQVLEARTSKSDATRGIVRMRRDVLNQKDETVMSWTAVEFFRRRPHPV